MTSLTESSLPLSRSVSPEGSATAGIAPLDPFLYDEMRHCLRCGGDCRFVAVFRCEAGTLGYCMGCGEEKFVGWSRTNSEAA